jgi:hypothetical protein
VTAIKLTLKIPCTREEATRFVAILVFLYEFASDPAAQPGPELDEVFGEQAREAILTITGYPEPLGITALYDMGGGVLTVSDEDGIPNLNALQVLLMWLYPDKLPIAYCEHVNDRPDLSVETIVGINRSVTTQGMASVKKHIVELRAEVKRQHRFDVLPNRSLPNGRD